MQLPQFRDFNHNNPKDCQLLMALTGEKEGIRQQLKKIIDEFDDSYGKPKQGITINYNVTTEIITPIWEGKNY